MADAQGNVRFETGEATHRLVFGMNALCALEDEFDCSIAEIGSLLTPVMLDAAGDPVRDAKGVIQHKPPKMSHVRSIFRAGMIEYWDGPGEPTVSDAGRMITELGIGKATTLIGEAFAGAFPDLVTDTGTASGNRTKK